VFSFFPTLLSHWIELFPFLEFGHQLHLIHYIFEVLSKILECLLVLLKYLRFVETCLLLSNETFQFQLKDKVDCLLLLKSQRIRGAYFLDYVVVLSDNYGDFISFVTIRTSSSLPSLFFTLNLATLISQTGVSQPWLSAHLMLSQKLLRVFQCLRLQFIKLQLTNLSFFLQSIQILNA